MMKARRKSSAAAVLAAVLAIVGGAATATFPRPAQAEEAKGGPPPSVRIRPLMLPVLTDAGKVERYTQLELTLEIKDSLDLPTVQGSIPRLHDALLAEMYRAIDAGLVVRGAVANAPAVRRMLLEASNKALGKSIISRVLITPTTRQSQWP